MCTLCEAGIRRLSNEQLKYTGAHTTSSMSSPFYRVSAATGLIFTLQVFWYGFATGYGKYNFMATDLIQVLAQRDGISTLPKIDPNTQDITADAKSYADKLSQAAIPVVLVGLYKYTRDENQAADIVTADFKNNWLGKVFGAGKEALISKVADYAGVTSGEASTKLDSTFDNATRVIRENLNDTTGNAVKNLFTEQRTNILSHLPAAIGAGDLLDDNSLDDRTNKMKGPVSDLMHKIEKTFAGTEGPENKEGM